MNVPDSMATEIPSSMLAFSDGNVDMSVINKKEWTSDQVGILSEWNYLETSTCCCRNTHQRVSVLTVLCRLLQAAMFFGTLAETNFDIEQ